MNRVREIWGTAVGVDVRDGSDDDQAQDALLDELFAWFDRVDALFSTWRDDSEIVRIARGQLPVGEASDETRTVLARCAELSRDTAGAFDIRATASLPPALRGPGWCEIDPSAMIKGWAIDQAAVLLARSGATRFCLNAGGDVLVGSGPAPGERWRVGIQHPWEPRSVAAVVEVVDVGVATSGRYERGDHVVDPRTGRPAAGLASVTVIAPDLARADAYSTAILALGRDGLSWLASRPDIDAMVVTDDRQVFTTDGFNRRRAAP